MLVDLAMQAIMRHKERVFPTHKSPICKGQFIGDLQDVEALRPFPLYAPTRGRIAGTQQRTRDLVLMDEPQPLLAEIGEREGCDGARRVRSTRHRFMENIQA